MAYWITKIPGFCLQEQKEILPRGDAGRGNESHHFAWSILLLVHAFSTDNHWSKEGTGHILPCLCIPTRTHTVLKVDRGLFLSHMKLFF